MNILLSGASGFLGKSILNELSSFNIQTIGRSEINSINFDLTTGCPIIKGQFDIVIHAAGKAHMVPKTTAESQEFYDVNVKGTENLLAGLAQSNTLPKSFVFISSVAVYGLDKGNSIGEQTALLAKDAYGLSKIMAEELVIKFCETRDINYAILRLPLLIGIDPIGNLKSMIHGIKHGYYFNIAGGSAKKSMVLASDVSKIIIKSAKVGGVYNLTDGYDPSFLELSTLIATQLGKPTPLNIPMGLAKLLALAGDVLSKLPINSRKLSKITSELTFDTSKAQLLLKWEPNLVLENFKLNIV